jgi:hypothetical protein
MQPCAGMVNVSTNGAASERAFGMVKGLLKSRM